MLGPMPPLVGGMATVLDNLKQSSLGDSNDLRFFDTGKNTADNAGVFKKLWAHISRYFAFVVVLVNHKPNIVHIHTCSGLTFYLDCVYAYIARIFGAEYILHVHGGRFIDFIQSQTGLKQKLAKATFAKAGKVIALSSQWKQRFEQKLQLSNVTVIVNGVGLPGEIDLNKRIKNHIVFLGAITKNKGVLDLITALAQVDSAFHLHIAGNFCADISERDLIAHIDSFPNLAHKVTIEGVVKGQKKHELMQTCDIFCLPSYIEGLPMSVLEAMAYKQAVLASDVGGLPDLIQSGENGILVAAKDINSLAQALNELLSDQVRKQQLSQAGSETFHKSYSLEAICPQYDNIYQELLIKN